MRRSTGRRVPWCARRCGVPVGVGSWRSAVPGGWCLVGLSGGRGGVGGVFTRTESSYPDRSAPGSSKPSAVSASLTSKREDLASMRRSWSFSRESSIWSSDSDIDERTTEIVATKQQLVAEFARQRDGRTHPDAMDISEADLARKVVAEERERLFSQPQAGTTLEEDPVAYAVKLGRPQSEGEARDLHPALRAARTRRRPWPPAVW